MSNESLPFVETLLDVINDASMVEIDRDQARAALHELIAHCRNTEPAATPKGAPVRLRCPQCGEEEDAPPDGRKCGRRLTSAMWCEGRMQPKAATPPEAETAWLIEAGAAGSPMWFTGHNGRMFGTANQAIRFARREDAEAFIRAWNNWPDVPQLVGVVVTEHSWVVPTGVAGHTPSAAKVANDAATHGDGGSIPPSGAIQPTIMQPACKREGCSSPWVFGDGTQPGTGWCGQHAPPNKPAPVSASARAEAMRRLREAWDRMDPKVSGDDEWCALFNAAGRLLALPEPDECAGLRELTGWVAANSHKNDFGVPVVDEDELLDEIRRLIAERGGK